MGLESEAEASVKLTADEADCYDYVLVDADVVEVSSEHFILALPTELLRDNGL